MAQAAIRRPLTTRSAFDPGSAQVWCMVDRVALGRFLSKYFGFFPVSIIPPMFHNHLRLHTTITRTTSGRSLGIFKQSNVLSGVGWKLDIKVPAHCVLGLKGYTPVVNVSACFSYIYLVVMLTLLGLTKRNSHIRHGNSIRQLNMQHLKKKTFRMVTSCQWSVDRGNFVCPP